MTDDTCAIGIDLGGTKVEIAIVDARGNIIDHELLSTHVSSGADVVVEEILAGAKKLQARSEKIIASVGIGVAGQISPKGDEVLFAPNLKWKNIKLKSLMEKHFSLPSIVINDVRAATWGEWLHGSGKDCKNFICLFIGTGIGGGIVSGGHLIEGTSNTAGEIGHTTLREGGRLCTCGNRGCLEAYCGGWGIAATLKEAAAGSSQRASTLLSFTGGDPSILKAEHLSEALKLKDPLAEEVYAQIVHSLAQGCVTFVNALNPQRIILGGGVVNGMPSLLPLITEQIKRSALGAAAEPLEIIPASLGNKAPVIGAAAASLHHLRKK